MLRKWLRDPINPIVVPLATALGRTGISPNALTVIGMVLTIAGAGLVAAGKPVGGGWVLVLGGTFDLLDGAVAKATKRETPLGAFIDSTTDRISDGAVLAAVAWHLRFTSAIGLALALAALVLGFLVSYIRARAEGSGFTGDVGVAERAERVILVAGGLIFQILTPALALLVALSLVTAVQRFLHVYAQAKAV